MFFNIPKKNPCSIYPSKSKPKKKKWNKRHDIITYLIWWYACAGLDWIALLSPVTIIWSLKFSFWLIGYPTMEDNNHRLHYHHKNITGTPNMMKHPYRIHICTRYVYGICTVHIKTYPFLLRWFVVVHAAKTYTQWKNSQNYFTFFYCISIFSSTFDENSGGGVPKNKSLKQYDDQNVVKLKYDSIILFFIIIYFF